MESRRQPPLPKRQFVMIISAILLCSSCRAVYANGDINDDDNHLMPINESETVSSECIPRTYLEQSETEKHGYEKHHIEDVTTSFLPAYCKIKHEDDLLIKESELKPRKRVKRQSLKNLLNLELLNSLSKDEVRMEQAKIMKSYMDPTVDPCVDFYSYSCGNWPKHNRMPKDKVILDTFEILREAIDESLRNLLTSEEKEEKVSPPQSPKVTTQSAQQPPKKTGRDHQRRRNSELKAKNLFKSCMNYTLIEKHGITPLLELLKKFGGWPLLEDDWDEKNFDWLQLTANLRRYNNDILIVQWVGPDIQNSTDQIFQIDQTTLGLPNRDYFIKDSNKKFLASYRTFMIKIIHLLGAKNSAESADEIIVFEKKLAKIMIPLEDRTNVSVFYQKMSIGELKEQIPEIDWLRYLATVAGRAIDPDERIVMFAKSYMKELVKLIKSSKPSTVANYLLWRFVRHRINNLDNRFLEAKQTFYFESFGREKSPPRWKMCVTQVNSNMGMATGALFVKKFFNENSKDDTIKMVHELQESFKHIIDNKDWIDFRTKRLAKQKLAAMSLKIGYPDYILSPVKLDDKYADLSIHPDKYFENTLNVLLHLSREEQRKVGLPVNKTIWQTYPAVVNAFYSRSKNQIMFPAGILQPPFYHHHFPKSLNFGGIGIVIGHEFTHGFDDKGRLFDKDGNLNKWWSDHAMKNFHNRTKCLVQQYNKYQIPDIGQKIDGETTQGENIADGGGIHQAFDAYKAWLALQTDPETLRNEILPGLNMTSAQLFFLNFGQVWCGDIRREANENKMKIAVHSPGRFRVIGALSNSVEFSKAFKCPLGKPMNPKTKCKVW